MSAETVNTTETVYRGTEANAAGDMVQTDTYAYSRVPATLVDEAITVFDPATRMPRTIRTFLCLMPRYLDITTYDRLLDERTGEKYTIQSVTRPARITGVTEDIRLALKRVSGDDDGPVRS